MWQPNRAQWRVIWLAAVVLIVAWPLPEGGSLGLRTARWLADPGNALPSLPEPLPMGLGDNGDAVAAHDEQEAEYYRLYESSRMMRARLRLKVAEDPWDPSLERRVLTGFGILSALLVWRLGGDWGRR